MDSIDHIRNQITSEVRRLISELPFGQPVSVSIGYITNSHRGYPVYRDGDVVEGLTVQIDKSRPNEITVHGDQLLFMEDNTVSAYQ